jgi:Flp pilus assembly protein TadD
MEILGPPDMHYLSAALGWMELGNCVEAKAELAKVASALAKHPNVLEVRWAIHVSEKEWLQALQAAEELVESASNQPSGWLHRAYALRRTAGGGVKAAWDALLPAVDLFPHESTIPYNLACYACQLGQLEDARRWLRRALAAGKKAKIRSMASSDPDLRPLWSEINSLCS